MRKIVGFLGLIVLLLQTAGAQIISRSTDKGIEWFTVAQGAHSNVRQSMFMDIRDESTYQNYWTRVTGSRGPAPKVNFVQNFVVLVQLDGREYQSRDFFVTTCTIKEQRLNVKAIVKWMPKGYKPPKEVCYPYVFIRVKQCTNPLILDVCEGQPDIIIGDPMPYDPWRPSYPEVWPQQAAFERVDAGQFSNISGQHEYVIDDEDDFAKYWRALKGPEGMRNIPDIDFDRDMVIAIHGGNYPNTGYSVRVWQAYYTNPAQLVVEYYVKTPDNAIGGAAMNTPYQIIVTKRRPNLQVMVNKLPGRPIR